MSSTVLPLIPQLERPYRCPGQPDGVTEAVHLARLAAGDDRCYGCSHRPADIDQPVPRLHWTADGHPRGRLHRELTLDHASVWIDAIAHELARRSPGARFAFGQDDRTASAKLAGTIEVAARHGLEVIDLGIVTRPVLESGVRRLGAGGGVIFTAGTRSAGWAGLDIVNARGQSRSFSKELQSLTPATARTYRKHPRASRTTPPIRPFDASVGYVATRAEQWQTAVGRHYGVPIRLAVAGGNEPTQHLVRTLLAATPVRIVPMQRSGTSSALEFDVAIRLTGDGSDLDVLDEYGRRVETGSLVQTLGPLWKIGDPDRKLDLGADGRIIASESSTNGPLRVRDGLLVLLLILARLAGDDCPASVSLRSV